MTLGAFALVFLSMEIIERKLNFKPLPYLGISEENKGLADLATVILR